MDRIEFESARPVDPPAPPVTWFWLMTVLVQTPRGVIQLSRNGTYSVTPGVTRTAAYTAISATMREHAVQGGAGASDPLVCLAFVLEPEALDGAQ
ncbi:hypothetical protein ACGFYF_41040 [Streptomyces lavendulae]|uniref:hypothetical protein n=1 Tax=Streptomyces lavendulae TaxID=1914 RepID=UPI0037155DE8